MVPFIPIRFVLGWGGAFLNSVGMILVSLTGGKPGEYSEGQTWIIELMTKVTAKVVIGACSVYYI
jgi:hypothetical protein